ncbi:MAG: AIR synthase related protein [Candidatus Helarchaeota archaeon]
MNLKGLIYEIKNFDGIKRKNLVGTIIKPLNKTLNLGITNILGAFGEDSAIFEIPNIDNYYFLMALDGIWYKLIDADPELAGYFSVLVNANDIYCKGGVPLVMVNNLGINSHQIGNKIIKGIMEGCKKYKIPMVGGHLHPNEDKNSLAVAILGMVKKGCEIYSSTAEPGDKIIFAVDLDGNFNEKFIYAWDTTSHKSSEYVRNVCSSMNEIAEKKLLTAAKDISNPGNIGTLGMLLESSKKGAIINLEDIPIPEGIEIERWVKAYPGFGIVATTKEENVEQCIKIFRNKGVIAKECGEITEEGKLILSYEGNKEILFDFKYDKIVGI